MEIGDRDPESITELVRSRRDEIDGFDHGAWKPWFPVIDFDRCTNCMQCLTFCLFDVYGVDKQQKITVQNQDNCKTDCPACSRVCPEVAILFPKYGKGPINGDVVREQDVQREGREGLDESKIVQRYFPWFSRIFYPLDSTNACNAPTMYAHCI